jgi:hypothetical protein
MDQVGWRLSPLLPWRRLRPPLSRRRPSTSPFSLDGTGMLKAHLEANLEEAEAA